MPVCKKIRFNRRTACAGDLDKRIIIKTRAITAPRTNVDYTETFSDSKTVWASLKTTKGRDTFYLTNLDKQVSHVFLIRWYDGLTSEKWVEFQTENYDIVEVEDVDERNEWYLVYCNVRGVKTSEVNHA